MNAYDWVTNEGLASGDLQHFVWCCKNRDTETTLTDSDKRILDSFDKGELREALVDLTKESKP